MVIRVIKVVKVIKVFRVIWVDKVVKHLKHLRILKHLYRRGSAEGLLHRALCLGDRVEATPFQIGSEDDSHWRRFCTSRLMAGRVVLNAPHH